MVNRQVLNTSLSNFNQIPNLVICRMYDISVYIYIYMYTRTKIQENLTIPGADAEMAQYLWQEVYRVEATSTLMQTSCFVWLLVGLFVGI